MARMIPELPVPDKPLAVRLHQTLNQALDDNHVVYQRLVDGDGGPDFWIRHMTGRSLFIAIASKQANTTESVGSTEHSRGLGKSDLKALLAFRARLLPEQPQGTAKELAPLLIIISNVADNAVQHAISRNPEFPLWLAGKEALDAEPLRALVSEYLGAASSPLMLAQFRRNFSPETVVPAPLNPQLPEALASGSSIDDSLLDYQQEQALKASVGNELQDAVSADMSRLQLLNGVAGSGKSLILLYRVRLLRNLYPDKSVLALVHSRPVARDLQARYRRVSNGDQGAEWLTFYHWCRQFVPGYLDLANETLEMELASDIVRVHLADTRITPAMLLDEIHFYKDRLLFSLQDYLNADRCGQGFQLAENMRKRVFVAMRAFEQRLSSMRKVSWHDLPRMAWERAEKGLVDIPTYDHILIDEAQFFAPIWFELIKKALKPESGHLMMAADPSQGFLRRKRSWLSAGLEVRGRTTKLRRSYRTTKSIMRCATTFLERRNAQADGDEGQIPSYHGQQEIGETPELHCVPSEQCELEWVRAEVAKLLDQGVAKENILVSPTGNIKPKLLANSLNRSFGQMSSIILCDERTLIERPRAIRICSLSVVSGLEAQHVLIVGTHTMFRRESAPDLPKGELEQLHAEHTRALYTGMTRAAKQLKVSMVGEIPDCLSDIGFRVVDDSTSDHAAIEAKEVI